MVFLVLHDWVDRPVSARVKRDAWVYVLSFRNGKACKISCTHRTPRHRLQEWRCKDKSKGFKLVYSVRVSEERMFSIEHEAHQQVLKYTHKSNGACPNCSSKHREEFVFKAAFGLRDACDAVDRARELPVFLESSVKVNQQSSPHEDNAELPSTLSQFIVQLCLIRSKLHPLSVHLFPGAHEDHPLVQLLAMSPLPSTTMSSRPSIQISSSSKSASSLVTPSPATLADPPMRYVNGAMMDANFAERLCRDRSLFTETLDVIKFVCKDLWAACWDRQVDNLRTNHRLTKSIQGIYVLQDNTFKTITCLSSWEGRADATRKAKLGSNSVHDDF
ncbi:hypothetical protein D9758_018665 [Tetrapyrgos nigripes]|uniref:Uncharacterized protein n=1 Tax=Tetrapyrgos nigripes TaxID=182062 RepID=A0A8H5BXC2_9AGAR|nr:hypothetical protein D9758_018665 [Tetrapyrgos nigripes]